MRANILSSGPSPDSAERLRQSQGARLLQFTPQILQNAVEEEPFDIRRNGQDRLRPPKWLGQQVIMVHLGARRI